MRRPGEARATAGHDGDAPKADRVRRPQFIAVDRDAALPDGTRFTVSYVELFECSVVLRLRAHAPGAAAPLAGAVLALDAEEGSEFVWRSSASGGMMPGEVMHEFHGELGAGAERLILSAAASGEVVFEMRLP